MKETQITRYEAEDGRTFETKEECEQYEALLNRVGRYGLHTFNDYTGLHEYIFYGAETKVLSDGPEVRGRMYVIEPIYNHIRFDPNHAIYHLPDRDLTEDEACSLILGVRIKEAIRDIEKMTGKKLGVRFETIDEGESE